MTAPNPAPRPDDGGPCATPALDEILFRAPGALHSGGVSYYSMEKIGAARREFAALRAKADEAQTLYEALDACTHWLDKRGWLPAAAQLARAADLKAAQAVLVSARAKPVTP